MELWGLFEGLFLSFGWLAKQVQQGKQRWEVALAFVAVPAIIGCALGWHSAGILGALFFAIMGAWAGAGIFWLVARNWSPGIDPNHLCELALAEGNYDEARRWCERGRELARRQGKPEGTALSTVSLSQLGKLAHLHGDDGEARLLYGQSLALARQRGDRESIAISLHQLGVLAYWRGDDTEARRLYRESLDIFAQLDSGYAETARENLVRLEQGHRAEPLEL